MEGKEEIMNKISRAQVKDILRRVSKSLRQNIGIAIICPIIIVLGNSLAPHMSNPDMDGIVKAFISIAWGTLIIGVPLLVVIGKSVELFRILWIGGAVVSALRWIISELFVSTPDLFEDPKKFMFLSFLMLLLISFAVITLLIFQYKNQRYNVDLSDLHKN
jgi:hypothetical protein